MMQPYLFPYVGYFGLLHASDRWIVFDSAQYIRKGWVNRNRVLTMGRDDWKYVRIPVRKAPRTTTIQDIQMAERNWCDAFVAQLDYYRIRRAPYYTDVIALIREVANTTTDAAGQLAEDLLANLLVRSLHLVCERLDLTLPIERFSTLAAAEDWSEPAGDIAPGDWARLTCEHLGATSYVNPPNGESLFHPDAFRRAGIELCILEPHLAPYDQKRESFVPGLSILDVLMWNSPEDARQLVEQYSLRRVA